MIWIICAIFLFQLKERVRTEFCIGSDGGPSGVQIQDKKILALSYAGAILCDDWVFSDIAIPSGATLKVVRNEELKPSLLIRCLFNNRVLPVHEAINIRVATGATLRDIVSRKVGLPVSAFQVISAKGLEIFDCHGLEDYGLDVQGSMVNLEIWEGWSDLICAAIGGSTSRLFPLLSKDEVLAKYQMRVVLYIAAHFGYVDMAVWLMRKGVRPGDPVGEHPAREWCDPKTRHKNCLKTAIHEAAEFGQLEMLRAFVVHDLCSVYARDADDLTPLNIALRRQHKECASFLLTKQWSKVPYNVKQTIPLSVYSQLKQWADRSKDKVGSSGYGGGGPGKSLSKVAQKHVPQRVGSLLGQGVVLDGYPPSRSLSKLVVEERRRRRQLDRGEITTEEPVRSKLDSLKLPYIYRDVQKAKTDQRKKHDEETDSIDRQLKGSINTKKNLPQNKAAAMQPTEDSGANEVGLQLPHILPKHHSSKSSINFSHDGVYLKTSLRAVRSSQDIWQNSPTGSSAASRKRPRKLNDLTPLNFSSSCPVISKGFMRNKQYVGYSPHETIQSFEQRLGLSTHEYARRCLDLAQSFSEKPWLRRVEQAVRIASKGVKKVFDGQRHILASEASLDTASPKTETEECTLIS